MIECFFQCFHGVESLHIICENSTFKDVESPHINRKRMLKQE